MQLLPKVVRLSRREKYWLALALISLPITKLGLRVFGFTRMGRMVARMPAARTRSMRREELEAAARMVNAAAGQSWLEANCLERSLALQWLLKLHAAETSLCIGVRPERGQIAAHAWLQSGDDVLNDRASVVEEYAPVSEQLDSILRSAKMR